MPSPPRSPRSAAPPSPRDLSYKDNESFDSSRSSFWVDSLTPKHKSGNHNYKQYLFDRQLTRLLDYCSAPAAQRNVDEILNIVNDEAPSLLSGLALSNNRAIARSIDIRL